MYIVISINGVCGIYVFFFPKSKRSNISNVEVISIIPVSCLPVYFRVSTALATAVAHSCSPELDVMLGREDVLDVCVLSF